MPEYRRVADGSSSWLNIEGGELTLAVMRSLREPRAPATEEELADFELDVLAGFVLARHSAGLADGTIRADTSHLELVRKWVRPAVVGDGAGGR